MDEQIYDAIIIGAGVSGCSCARELSRLQGRFLVLEAEDDVCSGTSKANSAIVHAGFDAEEGSLMARLNVEGNALFPTLAKELGFAFKRIGSLVVCTDEADRPRLQTLLERGIANGVEGLRIIEREELRAMEPHIADSAVCALWAPTAGICDPFGLTLAFAENAAANGVEFHFCEPVRGLAPTPQQPARQALWRVETSQASYLARCIINAAGVYADEIHGLVAAPDDRLSITARKGEYELLDTTSGGHVKHTIFMLPSAMGKGVLVTPTVHGNLLVGPTADDVEDKQATNTTAQGLANVRERAALTVKDIPWRETIASFAGLRAHQSGHEFVIRELDEAPGFIDCAGIESPGLTASPALGRMVARLVQESLRRRLGNPLAERPDFEPRRTPIVNLEQLSAEAWSDLIKQDPAYGTIVCRCRHVSEAQILEAIHRVPGARSLDGVKRRTWACTGRCQAGFCTPRIAELLAQELYGSDLSQVTKSGPGSEIVVGRAKQDVTKQLAEAYAADQEGAGR